MKVRSEGAKFCDFCGKAQSPGKVQKPKGKSHWLLWTLLGFALVGCGGSGDVGRGKSAAPEEPASVAKRLAGQPAEPYVLPAEFFLNAQAQRGGEGEIYIKGSTNFPDGMKMWVHVESGRLPLGAPRVVASDAVFISNGQFHTRGLWLVVPSPSFRPDKSKQWTGAANPKFRNKTFPAGKHNVRLSAYFNEAWQSQGVRALLGGTGGKKLHGKILKLTDPDVIDSDKTLDHLEILSFPQFSREAEAISLVKASTLTVPGVGRSAMNIEENVNLFMDPASACCRPGKGWSARAKGAEIYEVTFDYVDSKAGPTQAIWTANLATREVKYVNLMAKTFSWTPNY